jgi:hypothetical protein
VQDDIECVVYGRRWFGECKQKRMIIVQIVVIGAATNNQTPSE